MWVYNGDHAEYRKKYNQNLGTRSYHQKKQKFRKDPKSKVQAKANAGTMLAFGVYV